MGKTKINSRDITITKYSLYNPLGCSFSRIIYTLRMKNKVKVTGENNQVIIADFAKGRFSAVQLECRDLLSDATKVASPRIGGQYPYFCADCNVNGTSKDRFTEHLRGKKHLQQMYYKCMKMQRFLFSSSRYLRKKNQCGYSTLILHYSVISNFLIFNSFIVCLAT